MKKLKIIIFLKIRCYINKRTDFDLLYFLINLINVPMKRPRQFL